MTPKELFELLKQLQRSQAILFYGYTASKILENDTRRTQHICISDDYNKHTATHLWVQRLSGIRSKVSAAGPHALTDPHTVGVTNKASQP